MTLAIAPRAPARRVSPLGRDWTVSRVLVSSLVLLSGPTGHAQSTGISPPTGVVAPRTARRQIIDTILVREIDPQGRDLGVIPVVWGAESFNLRKPQNVAFAGPQRKTLYMVGAGAVFKMRLLAEGLATRAK